MPLTYQCSNVVLQGNNTSHISATLSAKQIKFDTAAKQKMQPSLWMHTFWLGRDSVM